MVPHQIISTILLGIPRVELLEELFNNPLPKDGIPRVELLEELFNNPLPKEFDQTKPTRYNVSSEVEFEI